MEWTFGIFLLAFLSLLSLVFNWLLSPLKENQVRLGSKMDRLESEVKTDFKRLEAEVKADFRSLESDFSRMESKMDQFLSLQKT